MERFQGGLDFAEVIRQGRTALDEVQMSQGPFAGPGGMIMVPIDSSDLATQLDEINEKLKTVTDSAERLQLITQREGIKLAMEGIKFLA